MGRQSDRGVALVVALMALLLLTAIGAALVLATSTEVLISSSFRGGVQALYAADAAVEWAAADVAAVVPDWPTLLGGSVRSPFVDGAPSGSRLLADGSVVDLSSVAAANPAWRLYAYGALRDLLPISSRPSPFYVVVFVAPDPAGPERLKLRAEAFGLRGAHRIVELDVLRSGAGVKFVAWREGR